MSTPAQAALFELPGHAGTGQGRKLQRETLRKVRDGNDALKLPEHFMYVTTPAQLQFIADEAVRAGEMTWDSEWSEGLKPWWAGNTICALSFYIDGMAYFVPHRMCEGKNNDATAIVNALDPVFSNPEIRKIGHALKGDMHMLRTTFGMEMRGLHFDTRVAAVLLDENRSHKLEDLVEYYLKMPRWKVNPGSFAAWPIKSAIHYACSDAEATWKLAELQQRVLRERKDLQPLSDMCYDMELPIVEMAYRMERRGIAWDSDYYESTMLPEIARDVRETAQEVCDLVGKRINLASTQEVAALLFDTLRLEQVNERHTDIDVLEALSDHHPVVPLIKRWRGADTLYKTFVLPLPDHVVDGCIHATTNTQGARTGRFSSQDPNLQNIPKRVGPIVRRAFVPRPGKVFIAMDYSQIELRLLAHFSGDEAFAAAFRAGRDIHMEAMERVLHITEAEYKAHKEEPRMIAARVKIKGVNFGIPYGIGPVKLAKKTGMTKREAIILTDDWFDAFPGVRKWLDAIKAQAVRTGYVTTVMGRRRRLPDAASANYARAGYAEREACNAPIQGSVADMMKKASLEQVALIDEEQWPIELLLQIHDENLFEADEQWARHNPFAINRLSIVMRDTFPLSVPVEVNVEILRRWGDKISLDDDIEFEEVA